MPIPLAAIGLGASAANSLLGTGLGIAQLIKARRYKMARPTYEIPDEIEQGLGLRQQLLNARMPGAEQMERNIFESGAAAMNNIRQGATDSASLLAGAATTQGSTNRALRDLSIQEAQDQERRVRGLEAQQAQMAGYRDKAFQINEMDPYREAAATRAALTEGGFQNISNAISDISAQAGQLYELDQMTDGGFTNSLASLFRRRQAGGISGAISPRNPFVSRWGGPI